MARETKIEYSISEPMTLEDLRWLVDQCSAMDNLSQVVVRPGQHYGGPDDYNVAKITVIGSAL